MFICSFSSHLFLHLHLFRLLYLQLIDFLSKNVDPPSTIYKELASKSFTSTLSRIVFDRNFDIEVKDLTIDLVYNWSDEFDKSNEATLLGLMRELADQLAQNDIFPKSQHNTSIQREPSIERLRQEEDELQRVLEMSKTDIGSRFNNLNLSSNNLNNTTSKPSTSTSTYPLSYDQQQQNLSNESIEPPQPISKVESNQQHPQRVKALYDFEPQEPNELGFNRGDIIKVVESIHKDWWRGECYGSIGIFPVNYVEILPNISQNELTAELQSEIELFESASDIDKLLRLLQSVDNNQNNNSVADDEEIQELYDKTLRLRPKIIKLIDKYSKKKDELILINDRFNKARDLFAGMMERPNIIQSHQQTLPYDQSNPWLQLQQPTQITSPYMQPPPTNTSPFGQSQVLQAPTQSQTQLPAAPQNYTYYQPGPYDEQWAQYYAVQAQLQQQQQQQHQQHQTSQPPSNQQSQQLYQQPHSSSASYIPLNVNEQQNQQPPLAPTFTHPNHDNVNQNNNVNESN